MAGAGSCQVERIPGGMKVFLMALLLAWGLLVPGCGGSRGVEEKMTDEVSRAEQQGFSCSPVLVDIFDNFTFTEGLQAAHGFSCLVRGMEKCVLFDTGSNGSILLANMDVLGVDPGEIEVVVLSHAHADHTGGLDALLKENPALTVYVPASFPDGFKSGVEAAGGGIVESRGPCLVCEGVHSTGELGEDIKEQSLVLETERGPVLLTGCAHPGIVEISERVRRLFGSAPFLVMGGFHLGWTGPEKAEQIAQRMKDIGVRFVAPGHCTGEPARGAFRRVFEERFVESGAGRVLEPESLTDGTGTQG
jgi:7,8-dihydropterin-6-yl-methyl-4-(beta-D-ribofuranosyl)aminobenzene 5'-phosphate synthase